MHLRTAGRVIALVLLAGAVVPAAWAQHGGGGAGASAGGRGVSAGAGIGRGTGSLMGRGTTNRANAGEVARGAGPSARAMATGPIALGAEQRRSYARALVREHRDLLDFDSRNQLIVRNQVVALPSGREALRQAEAAGFRVLQDASVDALGVALAVLEAPPGLSLGRALKRLRKVDPQGAYDFNHVYFESGSPPAATPAPAPEVTARAAARHAVRIGLVDGGLAPAHPALQGLDVHRRGCEGRVVPSTHGTAVASLVRATLAAGAQVPVQLYAADVYCGQATGGSVTELVSALSWLVQQDVPVINVSLVGPPNALLQRAVQAAHERGVLIVAAVGNDGPAAPPLYPASYPGAIAVTGVDAATRLLVEAGRGTHVDFATPGADIEAATLPEGFAPVRGTSFAAPVVAASLARLFDRPDPLRAGQAVAALARSAMDLGAQGLDPKYGHGCVGCAPRQAQAER